MNNTDYKGLHIEMSVISVTFEMSVISVTLIVP